MKNQQFIIQPHFRLQEWVAEEKGYFKDEGLDYIFQETVKSTEGKSHDKEGKTSGAFQTFEAGRTSDVNCACHWTVNVAASKGHGKLWADIYSVAPSGIFVPADSKIKTPEDLAYWKSTDEARYGFYNMNAFVWRLENVLVLPHGVPTRGNMGIWYVDRVDRDHIGAMIGVG